MPISKHNKIRWVFPFWFVLCKYMYLYIILMTLNLIWMIVKYIIDTKGQEIYCYFMLWTGPSPLNRSSPKLSIVDINTRDDSHSYKFWHLIDNIIILFLEKEPNTWRANCILNIFEDFWTNRFYIPKNIYIQKKKWKEQKYKNIYKIKLLKYA